MHLIVPVPAFNSPNPYFTMIPIPYLVKYYLYYCDNYHKTLSNCFLMVNKCCHRFNYSIYNLLHLIVPWYLHLIVPCCILPLFHYSRTHFPNLFSQHLVHGMGHTFNIWFIGFTPTGFTHWNEIQNWLKFSNFWPHRKFYKITYMDKNGF